MAEETSEVTPEAPAAHGSAPLPRPFPPISGGREENALAPLPPEIGGKGLGEGGQTREASADERYASADEPKPEEGRGGGRATGSTANARLYFALTSQSSGRR